MSEIAGINLNTTPAMPVMPDVFCLFPAVNPSRFMLPASRKRLSGSKQVASKAVAVELKTQAGMVLSRAELLQTAGAVITIAGGEQLYFVTIPGGGSFTFDPIRPAVPQEAEVELVVEGIIGGPSGASGGRSGLAYSLPYGPVYSPGVFASSETALPGLAAPYTVTLAPDRPVYDVSESRNDTTGKSQKT